MEYKLPLMTVMSVAGGSKGSQSVFILFFRLKQSTNFTHYLTRKAFVVVAALRKSGFNRKSHN